MVAGEKGREIRKDKFTQLLKLLLSFNERIEYDYSEIRHFSNRVSSNYADISVNNTNNRKTWCWIRPSEDTHPIWKCEYFSEKPPEEKLELVRNNNACYRCLGKGNSSSFAAPYPLLLV